MKVALHIQGLIPKMLVLIASNVTIPGGQTHTFTYSERINAHQTQQETHEKWGLSYKYAKISCSHLGLLSPELPQSGLDSRGIPTSNRRTPGLPFSMEFLLFSHVLHPLINRLQFFSRFHVHFITS